MRLGKHTRPFCTKPVRFAPPELMNYQGRSLVVDPDVFCVSNVNELLSRDMQGKALLARHAEGLDHRFAGTGVKVVLIKPGPTDTPMAADHKAAGRKLASPQEVARRMVKSIEAGRFMVYAPARWELIMAVVRNLPRFVFNRLRI